MGVRITIENMEKWYGKKVHAIHDLTMEINCGELLVVVGPSGCGKSTLIRAIAGLESIDEGQILMDGKVINHIPPKDRNIAMVPQSYALFPTMSVFSNIAFPLKMHKVNRAEIKASVLSVARRLEIENFLDRRPDELSGGQRQRVALARAMVQHPSLLLMDEPLSNLDAKLRGQMRREIVTLQKELGVTTIYVTHDQTEAMTMGDRIAVINGGVLQQIGAPSEVYHSPANVFTASFIGSPPMNIIDNPPAEMVIISEIDSSCENIAFGIRPEDIQLTEIKSDALEMTVTAVENTGREKLIYLENSLIHNLAAIAQSDYALQTGDTVFASFLPDKLIFFDLKTGKRLSAL